MKKALLAALLLVGIAGFAASTVQTKKQTEFEKIAAIVQRLDAVEKSLPSHHYVVNYETVREWSLEIFPYLFSEGIFETVYYPSNITLEFFVDPGRLGIADQVLAYAQCTTDDAVVINARQADPVSSWYNPPDFVLTLTHELAHIEGACSGNSQLDESSAQEIALEVLAAMVNGGNDKVLLSLVTELRNMGLGSLHYLAMKDHSLDDAYRAVVRKIDPNALDRADLDKRNRYWANYPKQRLELLYKYRYLPFTHIVASLSSGLLTGVEVSPGQTKTIKIDDLQYVFANLEALAQGVISRSSAHGQTGA